MNPKTDFSIQSILGGYDKNFTYIVTGRFDPISMILRWLN